MYIIIYNIKCSLYKGKLPKLNDVFQQICLIELYTESIHIFNIVYDYIKINNNVNVNLSIMSEKE